MISRDTISLVRDRTDIVAVVSEAVPSLKKRGRRFIGLCPFHKEKTPSFNVNPDTGFYHCFGCKESGDAISFLERVEGYAFAEAVRALAERAGVPVEEERSAPATEAERHRKDRESLYAIMQLAAVWYEEQLRANPQRSYALDEIARRGLEPGCAALQAFRVGYAPPGWDGLASYLKQQGISPAAAESVGLVVPRASGSGYYDRFRHRLMFAVIDAQGRVVAFSGRSLAALPESDPARDPPPKYINSPESPIYVKGATLFGLWQAKHAIRHAERALIVEGNFDVVSLHARGIENVVAPLGTAFTLDQANLLRRYATRVTLVFDGDSAGRKAVRASEDLCDEAVLDAEVVVLPDKTDPDDFVRQKGPDALRHCVSSAKGLFEHLVDMQLDEAFNAADVREQAQRIEAVVTRIARTRDAVQRALREAYADRVAARTDLARSAPNALPALKRKVLAAAKAARIDYGPRPSEARVATKMPGQEARKAIVEAVLDFPVLLDDSEAQGAFELLQGESARIVSVMRRCMRVGERGEKRLDSSEFLAQMPPAIQSFALARLAAPGHESIDEARAAVSVNGKILQASNVTRETGETVREQQRVVGDWEAEIELAEHVQGRVRQRHGVVAK
jgi:DNA primase